MKKNTYTFSIILFFVVSLYLSTAGCQVSTTSNKEVQNVIILIGDGMGLSHTYAAYTVNQQQLNMYQFPVTGLLLTYSDDNYITDSAAAGTAIACGVKTKNGVLGKDSSGNKLKNLFEYARDKNIATGLVFTCEITHATPAAFYAHVDNRNCHEAIAEEFINSKVSLAIGGGKKYFTNRSDKKNLFRELIKRGYTLTSSVDSIKHLNTVCLVSENDLPPKFLGRNDYLPNATKRALEVLSKNSNGFILMVEGSQIDWGGHQNNINYIITETLDFDKAVGVALDYARKNPKTLVLVLADHETGGLSLIGGDLKKGYVKSNFASDEHTAEPTIIFAYGPNAEIFSGVHQNTDIFHFIVKILNL